MAYQGNERRAAGVASRRRHSAFARFLACERGATSIEYGLICSLLFIAIVASVQNVGSATSTLHANIRNALN